MKSKNFYLRNWFHTTVDDKFWRWTIFLRTFHFEYQTFNFYFPFICIFDVIHCLFISFSYFSLLLITFFRLPRHKLFCFSFHDTFCVLSSLYFVARFFIYLIFAYREHISKIWATKLRIFEINIFLHLFKSRVLIVKDLI